ncbi:MAG TPA: hypothetical protein PLE77_09320 [Kiritimatiellia bacterium]|nr:hypothetical protein [Kiritimatiellia bacterium]
MPKPSRPELAFLVGAVLTVASIVLPLGWAVHLARVTAVVKQDMAALVEAGTRFYAEYGVWPGARMGDYGDCRYGARFPNREVVNVLRAVEGEGNAGNENNQQRIVFLDVTGAVRGRSGLNGEGDYVDPWGTPYQLVLDSDLNGVCDVVGSIYGVGIGGGMIVWSCGPDRRSETGDDILSWKREMGMSRIERHTPFVEDLR